MAHRTREEVFAWAAAETTAGRKPSYASMATWGTDYTLDRPLSLSTVKSWVRRHHDPRDLPGRGVHSTATPTATPCNPQDDPDEDAPTPPASSGGCSADLGTSGHFSTLTAIQERAVYLKVAGRTHTDIARELGVSRNTVIGWQHLRPFAAALSELRSEAHVVSRESLLAGAQEGVAGLREVQRIMLAIIQSDAVALSPNDLRILEAGDQCHPIIDPRLQIQAARVYIQGSRVLMDRGGFHARSELHLSGGGGISIDLSGEDLDDLEAGLEDDLAALEVSQGRLRLLEQGE